MNLRQKIKKAKKEMRELEQKDSGSYMVDIYRHVQEQSRLQKIINHKRNFNLHYEWSEPIKIDMKKLTYIAIRSNFKELGVMISPNGKPISIEKANEFINTTLKSNLWSYSKKIASQEKPTAEYERKHVDYYISLSNDRTKSKKLTNEKLFYQFIGDEKIYRYQSEKKESSTSEKQTEKTFK